MGITHGSGKNGDKGAYITMRNDLPSLFNMKIPYIFKNCRKGKHEGCQGAGVVYSGTVRGFRDSTVVYCECECHRHHDETEPIEKEGNE